MALDFTGLMTVIGENVKKIDIFNTLITSLETYKDDIYTDLAAEGFQDQYVALPAQFLSMKNAVAGWISTLISDVSAVLIEPDLVLDELSLYSYDVTSVLNALYDYMDDNSETIETSVVSLGGSDVEKNACVATISGVATQLVAGSVLSDQQVPPSLCVSRTLDGTSAPGNNVTAHIRYDGQESQLARSATITAELLSNTTVGSETAQIYSPLTSSNAYLATAESPGIGPVLTNVLANNLITSNAKFDTWVGNAPTGWTMSGTVTTDYVDESGTGAGPLQMKTQGVTALKQVTGLVHNKLYFLAMYVENKGNADADPNVVGIKLRTLADATLTTQVTASMDTDDDQTYAVVYGFFRFASTVNLDDVYVELEYVTEGANTNNMSFHKVVVAPATYYNGLGWAWFVPYHLASDKTYVPLGVRSSIAIANNNNGKFQTFFRKAYNVQLPTADSPTVNDALAGG